MSGVVGDLLTVHCGRDWLEMTASADEGFLSWILPLAVDLFDVINYVSDTCFQDSAVLCPPLWNQSMDQTKLTDDADLSSNRKRIRKWTKCVTKMRKEADDLTKFMLECLPSVAKDKKSSSLFDDDIDGTHILGLHDNNTANIAIGFLDERSLTSTLWWIICKNVDILCLNANNKHSKNFLAHIIQASLSCLVNYDCRFQEHDMSTTGRQKTGTAPRIELEFLRNIISYEQRIYGLKVLQNSAEVNSIYI